jgi:hypothetical protein
LNNHKYSLNNQLQQIEAAIQSHPLAQQNHSMVDSLCKEHARIQNKLTEYYRQRCKKGGFHKVTGTPPSLLSKEGKIEGISSITNSHGEPNVERWMFSATWQWRTTIYKIGGLAVARLRSARGRWNAMANAPMQPWSSDEEGNIGVVASWNSSLLRRIWQLHGEVTGGARAWGPRW